MAVYEIQNDFLVLKVNSCGAELCSVISKEDAIEYIWQADPSVWPRHAPHLFPIVGKLRNGRYHYDSATYHLPQHGFARDTEFTCIEQTDERLVFELRENNETLKQYPFSFKFQIAFILTKNSIHINYSVFNPHIDDLYFSIGAHPAFNCPLEKQESFKDYELVFPGKDKLVINTLSDGLITSDTKTIYLNDHRLEVSEQLFDNDALVFMNTQIEEVQLISKATRHGVVLKSHGWPYFGIWSKKQTGKFICLEPWYGIADADFADGNFVEKIGIIKLPSKHYFKCSFEISCI